MKHSPITTALAISVASCAAPAMAEPVTSPTPLLNGDGKGGIRLENMAATVVPPLPRGTVVELCVGTNFYRVVTGPVKCPAPATAAPLQTVPLQTVAMPVRAPIVQVPGRTDFRGGVNVSGCEFKAEMCPKPVDIAFYADAGVQAIRLPVKADRLVTPAQIEKVAAIVLAGTSRGVLMILDDHRYKNIGDPSVAEFWLRVGPVFKGNPLVAFDLQNEPNGGTWTSYGPDARKLVLTLRSAGIDNVLYLEHRQSSGANRFDKLERSTKGCESAICSLVRSPALFAAGDKGGWRGPARASKLMIDPLDRLVHSVHGYPDKDGSGTSAYCDSGKSGRGMLASATTAARKYGLRMQYGEVGFARASTMSTTCERLGREFITYMKANRDVWAGVTFWGGGPKWNGSYTYRIELASDKASTWDRPNSKLLSEAWTR